jgi:hypothetical protein
MKNEIEKIENKQVSLSAENLIEKALSNNVSVETIERLLAMRKELKAEFAKEQFDLAMANFQKTCPVIKKKKIVKDKNGQARYSYAPIEDIINQVKELISDQGLSYTIRIENSDKDLTAICKVSHLTGHSDESKFVVPIGAEQFMTDTQKFGARATFAKRYAFCNAFGIMTGDDDNDGNVEDKKPKAKITVQGAIKQIREEKDKEKLDKYRLWLDKQTVFAPAQKNVILMAIDEQAKTL